MAYLHGDLNGKNIIIDHQSNVWLIDFFHTHRGHILKDLIKMENDILYIFTKINSLEELQEGLLLTDKLLNIHDLKPILPKKWMEEFKFPQIKKAFLSIRKLRSFYADLIQTDRDPYQIYTGLMRYAMHTLSFDESNLFQKKWALYTGSLCAEKIKNSIYASKKLRIDFLTLPKSAKGKIGLTLLPGRKDKERMIYDDLEVLKENQITHIVCLLTEDEMVRFGVPDLKKQYAEKGFEVYYFPILDQGITEKVLTHSLFDWIENALENKKNILIHCVGGLGRSGMIAAAFLKNRFGFSPEEAISTVRKTRGERAVETRSQEQFVYDYD
ncbi:MAG: hypothetical protein A2Y41_10995 [Spirochaetes bacterium GWB1_36_13]|nr:MAG: hypothetical protein A2Y41_10995 [Spirochaetes bacterium GWB1_36_13]